MTHETQVGTLFVTELRHPWSGPGFVGAQWHTFTVLCKVIRISGPTATFTVLKVLEETGRMPGPNATTIVAGTGEESGGFALEGPFKMRCPTISESAGVQLS